MLSLLQSSLIQPKTKPSRGNDTSATSQTANSDATSQSPMGGAPLETSVRRQMESKFNYNFSNVRIHKDAESQKMASSVGADAFTTGRDIFFGQNRYDPSSRIGLGLLAHELTHVVQQDGKRHQMQTSSPVIESGDSFELEANSAAISVLENRPVQVTKRVVRTPIQRGLWSWVKSAAKSVGSAIAKGVEVVGDLASQGIQWLAENVPVVGDIKRILKKAGDVIGLILGDPIGFLGNLLSAIKGGFNQFSDNIWEHLKTGVVEWLFGTMAEAGIQIPKSFDLKSIFGLVLQILGLTASRLRQKAVKLVGEKNMAILEKVWQYVSTLISEGPKGLWELIKEDASMLIDLALDSIKKWIVTTVIKKAVVKLASMFNPVGAIVQALIMIYDVVMFVIEKAQQIAALVEAVVNSISMIATGNIKPASDWIEKTLARLIPVAIGFLASLLGLGGLSSTIRETIGKIQGSVDSIVDKALAKILQLFRRKDKKEAMKEKEIGGDQGEIALQNLQEEANDRPFDDQALSIRLVKIREEHKFSKLTYEKVGDEWIITSAKSPEKTRKLKAKDKQAQESKITWEVDSASGYGKKMIADPLTSNHPVGSSTTGTDLGDEKYAKLAKRRKGGGTYYVQGHLLNAHLGGPGDDWKNLTPITRSTNARHYAWVEKIVSKAIKAKKILRYVITATYGRVKNKSLIDTVRKKTGKGWTNEKKETIVEIIESEKHVPKKLSVEVVDKSANKDLKIEANEIDNAIEQGSPDDYHVET